MHIGVIDNQLDESNQECSTYISRNFFGWGRSCEMKYSRLKPGGGGSLTVWGEGGGRSPPLDRPCGYCACMEFHA